MADTLVGTFEVKASVTVTRDLPNRSLSGTAQTGVNNFPALKITYASGEDPMQAEDYMCAEYTIAGSGHQDIDLAGGITTDVASNVTAKKVKEIIVALKTPDGTAKVRVGPQNLTNAFQGPFTGLGADAGIEVTHSLRLYEPYVGWTVTASTGDLLRIANPGGASVTVEVLIVFTT